MFFYARSGNKEEWTVWATYVSRRSRVAAAAHHTFSGRLIIKDRFGGQHLAKLFVIYTQIFLYSHQNFTRILFCVKKCWIKSTTSRWFSFEQDPWKKNPAWQAAATLFIYTRPVLYCGAVKERNNTIKERKEGKWKSEGAGEGTLLD